MKNASAVCSRAPATSLLPQAPPPHPATFLPPNLFFFFFSFLLSFFFFSHKFGKKVTYFNYLSELREHLKYDQLSIPQEVLR